MVALAHTEASASHQPFSGTELYESKYQVQSFSSIMVYYSGFCLSAAYLLMEICAGSISTLLCLALPDIFSEGQEPVEFFSRCNISAFPLINP